MRTHIRAALAAVALSGAVLPSAALAGDETRARAAVEAARGKIDAAEKAGVEGEAATDALVQARAALAVADRQIKDDDEDRAMHAAERAATLADLALARSELAKVEAERTSLAGR